MNRKVKSFKTTNSVFIGTYAMSNVIPSVRSPVFQPRHRPYNRFVTRLLPCQ